MHIRDPKARARDPTKIIEVPCGHCIACLTNRRTDWTIRLLEEFKANNEKAIFLTLTYDDEHIPFNEDAIASVYKVDIQHFIKRLRKKIDRKIRYYVVGEYGTKTYRPHYHAIIFNIDNSYHNAIEKAWIDTTTGDRLGHTHIGTVTIKSLSYITKYHVNKGRYPHLANPPFTLMSRKPGIGYGYVEKFKKFHQGNLENAYYPEYEKKKRLPRYFKNKLYNEDERHKLATAIETGIDMKEYEDFKKKYPHSSYFQYRVQQIENYEKTYREKSNFNNKI